MICRPYERKKKEIGCSPSEFQRKRKKKSQEKDRHANEKSEKKYTRTIAKLYSKKKEEEKRMQSISKALCNSLTRFNHQASEEVCS